MIDFAYYIKAKSVADTYLQHIKDLNGTPKKQHFLVRLSMCEGYKDILKDNRTKTNLFKYTFQELERNLNLSWEEMWDEMEDKFGYKKEIKEIDSPDIKFYFGMTKILGLTGILLRNGQDLPEDIEKKITRYNLMKMIDIANNDQEMKIKQGTTYVNGIGEIICLKWLKNSLVHIDWKIINECYKKIWDFYIDKALNYKDWILSKNKRHNYIYGLTHCIINITNFYTRFIGNDETWMDEIKQTSAILSNLIDDHKESNYVIFNDDTLAEMLLTIKLCGASSCIERLRALDALSLRFNSQKLIFDEHKRDSFKEELLDNEHTNILYVLNVLF